MDILLPNINDKYDQWNVIIKVLCVVYLIDSHPLVLISLFVLGTIWSYTDYMVTPHCLLCQSKQKYVKHIFLQFPHTEHTVDNANHNSSFIPYLLYSESFFFCYLSVLPFVFEYHNLSMLTFSSFGFLIDA